MTATVYPGLLDSVALAELRERIEKLERLVHGELAAQRAGETLLDALVIDSQGIAAGPSTVNPSSTPPIVDEPDASREPLMAEERYSAPSRASTFTCARCLTTSAPHQGCRCGSNAERPFFQVGDRCCVHTGGDPCVKPGTVECQEHDSRWLISLDRAGKIRVEEKDMVLIPGDWR